jgi:hypothetical protein
MEVFLRKIDASFEAIDKKHATRDPGNAPLCHVIIFKAVAPFGVHTAMSETSFSFEVTITNLASLSQPPRVPVGKPKRSWPVVLFPYPLNPNFSSKPFPLMWSYCGGRGRGPDLALLSHVSKQIKTQWQGVFLIMIYTWRLAGMIYSPCQSGLSSLQSGFDQLWWFSLCSVTWNKGSLSSFDFPWCSDSQLLRLVGAPRSGLHTSRPSYHIS